MITGRLLMSLKDYERKEKITVSFVVDRYGYAATTLESKTVDKFILQMSNELHDWILDYLVKGEITMPIPSSKERLLKDMAKDSNELATNTLTNFLMVMLLDIYMSFLK